MSTRVKQMQAFRSANWTYLKYLSTASEALRSGLKEDIRSKLRRENVLKVAKWEDGKQGASKLANK